MSVPAVWFDFVYMLVSPAPLARSFTDPANPLFALHLNPDGRQLLRLSEEVASESGTERR